MFDFIKKKLKKETPEEKTGTEKKKGRRRGRRGGKKNPSAAAPTRRTRQTERKSEPRRRQTVKPTPLKQSRKTVKTAMNRDSSDSRLYFGSLGGIGEIGNNLYLYGTRGQWIIVDMGNKFPDDKMAGAEYVIPDVSFLRSIKDRILGLLLTHAHYDHFAAIPHHWEEIRCPVYGTPFSLKLLSNALEEFNLNGRVPLKEVSKNGARFKLGPFDIEYIHITHSIPQASSIVIRTEQGTIFHTGDFDFDPTPMLDKPNDLKRLAEIGREGVLAVMCDSTNALVGTKGRSEHDAYEELSRVIPEIRHGKTVLTCFSSNVTRVQTIADIAKKMRRKLVVLGRSIETNIGIAKSEEYLRDLDYLSADEAQSYDDDKVIYLVTGTQGEPRSVLTRIAEGTYNSLRLKKGDNVIFSSLIIPGNEKSIFEVHNNLARKGVNVISVLGDPLIHASGHATRGEIEQLYGLIKPKMVVPVHGEPLHLMANRDIAEDMGIGCVAIENGEFIAFEGEGEPKVVEVVPTAEIIIDGNRQVSAANEIFKSRRKINFNGAVFVSLVVNRGGLAGKPEISSIGVFETDQTGLVKSSILNEIKSAFKPLSKSDFANDDKVKEVASNAAKKVIREQMDKKPPVSVHITRV
ncbi:MAG: ribonuclease J [Rickettsiales bacterium]|jgi:ribonuclease J|nr:ribonuclease J [Rickettsiales bacterium]